MEWVPGSSDQRLHQRQEGGVEAQSRLWGSSPQRLGGAVSPAAGRTFPESVAC